MLQTAVIINSLCYLKVSDHREAQKDCSLFLCACPPQVSSNTFEFLLKQQTTTAKLMFHGFISWQIFVYLTKEKSSIQQKLKSISCFFVELLDISHSSDGAAQIPPPVFKAPESSVGLLTGQIRAMNRLVLGLWAICLTPWLTHWTGELAETGLFTAKTWTFSKLCPSDCRVPPDLQKEPQELLNTPLQPTELGQKVAETVRRQLKTHRNTKVF